MKSSTHVAHKKIIKWMNRYGLTEVVFFDRYATDGDASLQKPEKTVVSRGCTTVHNSVIDDI